MMANRVFAEINFGEANEIRYLRLEM